jgi:hypothetical protein
MSLSFLTPEVANRMEEVLSQIEQSSSVWKDFVTLPANMSVITESGNIPSLRWLIDNHMQLIANAISTIRSISQVVIDPNTRNLVVQYSDGISTAVGAVDGENGKDGLSVINVELYADPLEVGRVYFQTQLSNGVVLRTQNSIEGYNGKSVKQMVIIDNQILTTLDDGTELPAIPVEGLTPISVAGAEIRNGEMFIRLTNGTETSAGLAEALQGRGIADIRKTNDKLQVSFTDDPSTYVEIGTLNGIRDLQMVHDRLMVTTDDAPNTPKELATLTSLVSAEITAENHLVLITNAQPPNNRIDLGLVTNLRPRDGEDGAGVVGAAIRDNQIFFTLSSGQELPGIAVNGLTPVNIVGAAVRGQNLYFQLSNGQELLAGLAADLKGAGVKSARLDPDGKLYFFYENDIATPVYVGDVPGIAGMAIENGRLIVRYTNSPDTPVDVGSMLAVTNIRLDQHRLIITFNTGQEAQVGQLLALTSLRVVNNVLTVTYNNGVTEALANVKGDKGDKGDKGRGIQHAEVNAAGDLEITWDDGSAVTNAGRVRDPILNFIGKTYNYVATPGQEQFAAPNGGEVLVFVDGVLKHKDLDFDLQTANVVDFLVGLVGGEKVTIVAYQFVGTTPSGRGIQTVQDNQNGTYDLLLENGTSFIIDTRTPVDPATLPPGIVSINVLPNGDIKVVLTNSTEFIAGSANNAVSIVGVEVDGNGNLIVETDDPTNQFLNAGSVLSGLMIQSATVDANTGHLLLTLSSGAVLDAGQTGNFVTQAAIRPNDGMLQITLSNGTVLDAGTVRNPLIGTMFDFICFQGQYEFDVPHSGYQVLFWANGVALQGTDLILTDPTKVKVRTPRVELDVVRIVLLTAGNVAAASIVGEATAPRNSFYGKNAQGEMGFHTLGLNKYGVPYDFLSIANQRMFDVTHSGQVEVIVNGRYLHDDEYSLPPGNMSVYLNNPLTASDRVRIIVLNAPRAMGDFEIVNYARIKQRTNGHGGTFAAGAWQIRSLNTIDQNAIGAVLNSNRILLPSGKYYIRGWAACNGVSTNALRLYNQTTRRTLLEGDAVFGNAVFVRGQEPGNNLTPIEGYFEVTTQSALVLQHKCLITKDVYGFGAVGGGHSTSVFQGNIGGGYWTENRQISQANFGAPATLVDLQLWKVG